MARNQSKRNQNAFSFLRRNYPFSLVLVSVIIESYRLTKTNKFKSCAELDFKIVDQLLCGCSTAETAATNKISQQKVQKASDRFMTHFWDLNKVAFDFDLDRRQRLN
jgi:hypothetical protein